MFLELLDLVLHPGAGPRGFSLAFQALERGQEPLVNLLVERAGEQAVHQGAEARQHDRQGERVPER